MQERRGECVWHPEKKIWLSWLTEGSGGLICHQWRVDRGYEGQSLSDLEASVCSNSDGQNEMGPPPHFPRIPSIPRPPAQPWPWAQQGQNPHPDPSIMRQLFLIKTPPPSHPTPKTSLLYHPQSSVPFSSNHAVWPGSPAFNLPSRSGAEANKALG